MARPRSLPDDLASVKAVGITAVISLLESAEAVKTGLAGEAAACTALGLSFLTHPIRDMHLPDHAPFQSFAADIATRIRSGEHVAIHCYASIGRSSMLACTVLGHFGHTPRTAIAHISKMRGTAVPDTPEQAEFIHRIMAASSPHSFNR